MRTVFGLLTVVSDPSIVAEYEVTAAIKAVFSIQDDHGFLVLLFLLTLFIFVSKNIILMLIVYSQTHITAFMAARLSSKLFAKYMQSSFSFFLTRNSAELIRNISSLCNIALGGTVVSAIRILTESLIIITIACVLIIVEPLASTISIVLMGLTAMAYVKFFGPHFIRWGKRRAELERSILQWLKQSFSGIKETKVLGCESYFETQFKEQRESYAHILVRRDAAIQMPRYVFESVIIIIMVVVALVILQDKDDTGAVIASLGLFGVAGLRLMPSATRITASLNEIKSSQTAVNIVYDDFNNLTEPPVAVLPSAAVGKASFVDSIGLENTSYSYPNTDTPAIEGINLMVRKGELVGFVGETGSGKSTTVDIILGLHKPSGGHLLIDGDRIEDALRLRQGMVGYVPQAVFIADDTLRRNVAFGVDDSDIDDDKVWGALRLANIDDLVAELRGGLDTFLGENGVRLSGGQRQRIGIARALFRDPEIIVLDEATSSLDTKTEDSISRAINSLRGNKTIIVIAHRLSTVQNSDNIFFFDRGGVVDAGTFAALYARNPSFKHLVELSKINAV